MTPRSLSVRATDRLGWVDLTPLAEEYVASSGVVEGAFMAFCAHTTCSILVNEWESGARHDLRRKLEEVFPRGGYYAHDDMSRRTENLVPGERANGASHLAQMFLGQSSQLVPVSGGRLLLGRWQRIFLLELDEPKDRTVVLHAFGHSTQSLVTNSQNASPAYRP